MPVAWQNYAWVVWMDLFARSSTRVDMDKAPKDSSTFHKVLAIRLEAIASGLEAIPASIRLEVIAIRFE